MLTEVKNMYGKKIKYFRLKAGLTLDELAKKLSCTKAAVSQYENGHRDPDQTTLEKISKIFHISWSDLLTRDNLEVKFDHCSFRKKSRTNQNAIEILKADIEEKCINQITVMDILGIVPQKPFKAKNLSLDVSLEDNVKEIRKALGVSFDGPIYYVTHLLERLGIIVLTFTCPDDIEGLNGTADGIPYIFFNSSKTVERQRFTLVHEFCHLFFNYLEDTKELEKYINKLAGHVLVPDQDLFNEFGRTNRNLNTFLRNSVAKEYKVAPSCLMTRLYESGVVTEMYYRNFFKYLNANVGKAREGTLLDGLEDSELPTEYTQRVYKALDKELITKSRAAELLSVPLIDVMNNLKAM